MSTARDIIAALSPLGYPVAQDAHIGKEDAYFVFNLSTYPGDFADDEPQHERVMVMVHFYCPMKKNITDLKRIVKLTLQSAGFTYPAQIAASEDGRQHVVFECERAEGIGDGL